MVKVGGLRVRVIKSSVLVTLVNPLLIVILLLSGTATSMPIAVYAQSDTISDSGTVSSDVNPHNDLATDDSQNGVIESEGDSDVSDSNEGIDDISQVSTDETVVDNKIDNNQDEANSSDDNLPTDATRGSDPIADAGKDFEVDENTDVLLDGSASVDQDGEISSYSWEQTDGYGVELNDADSAQPSFVAPDVDSNQELSFRLSVTDNNGLTDIDSVSVLIKTVTINEEPDDVVSIPIDEQDTEQTPQVKSDLARGTDTLKCTDNQTDCNHIGQRATGYFTNF